MDRKSKQLLFMVITISVLFLASGYCMAGSNSTYLKNGQLVSTPDFSWSDDFKVIDYASPGYNRLTDYANGYTLNIPAGMFVDASLSAVRTMVYDQQTQIEIYRDDFNNTVHNSAGYINYSNLFIKNSNSHYLQEKKTINANGLKINLLKWYRNKLYALPGDKNFYLSAEITKNSKEVYTVLIKSSQPVDQYLPVIKSFNVIQMKGTPRINIKFQKKTSGLNTETAAFYQQYFGDKSPLKWGIFEPTAPEKMDYLAELEKQTDHKFDFLVLYKTFDAEFPSQELLNAYNENKFVELTLQTMWIGGDNSNITYDILSGKYDYFFNNFARKAKDFQHPILFRLNNEMNGDWCVYSSFHSSKDTDLYKAVWRHVYDIFIQNKVDNVLWVWNPNDVSFPGFQWNHSLNYFPGERYVDIVGLTGYNTGTFYPGEKWREFTSIYDPLYWQFSSWFNYPFMITEFGCNSVGGDKLRWIGDMFANIRRYPGIKAAIWFNGTDCNAAGMPARIYRLDENGAVLNAFRQGFENFK
ncbi:MAG: glycosyl hydrolase [Syntrophomonas sp.]